MHSGLLDLELVTNANEQLIRGGIWNPEIDHVRYKTTKLVENQILLIFEFDNLIFGCSNRVLFLGDAQHGLQLRETFLEEALS